MLELISFSKQKHIPFQPGVFSKCSAAIESCKLLEQLQSANQMVENNYHQLTECQYITLKNRIARHPAAANLVLIPANSEYTVFISKPALVITCLFGIACWAVAIWLLV